MQKSEGLRLLRKWFRSRPETNKAQEARDLEYPCRQSLDHILSGARSPTLGQAVALQSRYGIDAASWTKPPRGGKV